MIIIEENKKDDKVDADKDGKADASELSGGELVKRKVILVLTKMNPEKVNDTLASIYKGTSVLGANASFFPLSARAYFVIRTYVQQCGCRCWPSLPFNSPVPSPWH